MIRAAIVGLGSWGKTLVDSVHGKTTDIRFTTACTRTPANAEAYCRERVIQLTTNYDAVLADKNINAVVLATRNSLHEAQITQAAAVGKHVYVEKPFTLTPAEFARCIRDGSAYPISANDVLHGVAVLEAAIQSAATKKPVQVTD